jgi:hypothetical protein
MPNPSPGLDAAAVRPRSHFGANARERLQGAHLQAALCTVQDRAPLIGARRCCTVLIATSKRFLGRPSGAAADAPAPSPGPRTHPHICLSHAHTAHGLRPERVPPPPWHGQDTTAAALARARAAAFARVRVHEFARGRAADTASSWARPASSLDSEPWTASGLDEPWIASAAGDEPDGQLHHAPHAPPHSPTCVRQSTRASPLTARAAGPDTSAVTASRGPSQARAAPRHPPRATATRPPTPMSTTRALAGRQRRARRPGRSKSSRTGCSARGDCRAARIRSGLYTIAICCTSSCVRMLIILPIAPVRL